MALLQCKTHINYLYSKLKKKSIFYYNKYSIGTIIYVVIKRSFTI